MAESDITDAVEVEDFTDAVIVEDVTDAVLVEDATEGSHMSHVFKRVFKRLRNKKWKLNLFMENKIGSKIYMNYWILSLSISFSNNNQF